jgi:hypothetical protein
VKGKNNRSTTIAEGDEINLHQSSSISEFSFSLSTLSLRGSEKEHESGALMKAV